MLFLYRRRSAVPPVLSQDYALSKRTGFYALGAFQRANGHTLSTPTFTAAGATNRQIDATASIGDGFQSTPSSSSRMFAAGLGIVHRF